MSRIGRSYDELLDERSMRIPESKTQYPQMKAYSETAPERKLYRTQAIRGIHKKTVLNQFYFSTQNIKKVQNKLRYTIWKVSKGQFTIGNQEELNLMMIMRSTYLQYGKNLPTHIAEQIEELNTIVVDTIYPDLLSNIKQYNRYLRDANEPWRMIERPTTTKIDKTLQIDSALGFGDPNFKFN